MKKHILLIAALILIILDIDAQSTKVKALTKTIDSLQAVARILNTDNDNCVKLIRRKDAQMSNKQRQINNLNSDLKTANSIIKNHEATIDTLNEQWDNCLNSYHDCIFDLQAIALTVYNKKLLPRKRLKLIKCVIEKE